MKVLLINPPFDYYSRHLPIGEPLSLGYLASYLMKFGYAVEILDAVADKTTRHGTYWHYGLQDNEVAKRIKEFKPDVAGITCPFSLRIDAALRVAKLVKQVDKKIITVVGGIHPTIFPLETVSHQEVDYVIIGEGEESLLALIRKIESGKKLKKIAIDGCAYKENGNIKLNQKRNFIENLDSIPLPARELLPMEFYLRRKTILYGLGGRRAASIITSRSCPRRCSFCSMYLSHGSKWRGRSAENVLGEIEELVRKYRVEEIFFMDDNLTFDKKRMMKLCELILRKGVKFRWNTPNGVRADSLDVDLARIMKKAGCVNVCIGIESGNEKIRNGVIKKGLSEEQINKALNACRKVGLPVVGFFILGIPGETEKTFADTVKMVKNLPFSMIATSFFTPLPGTKLYDDCVRNGYIEKDYWRKLKQFNIPIVETPAFNKSTLKKWEKKIYYEFLKSHLWPILFQTLTFKNDFLKIGQAKRFLLEKFGISL